jgi:arylsulfatase A-like enzyme
VVIGTLREEGILDDTIICFTADHGDMLGDHRMWAKHQMYDGSNRVPMILMGTDAQMRDGTVGHHRVDERIVGLADVAPTLLELAGIPIPENVEGMSMTGEVRRDHIFTLWGSGESGKMSPTRMVRDQRYKLVYYAYGNVVQLFDMQEDPDELKDRAGDPELAQVEDLLTRRLTEFLAADRDDALWIRNGELTGLPERSYEPELNRGLTGQRGVHWPPPPVGPVPWS